MPENTSDVTAPDWNYSCASDTGVAAPESEWALVSGPDVTVAEAFSMEDGAGICAEREA